MRHLVAFCRIRSKDRRKKKDRCSKREGKRERGHLEAILPGPLPLRYAGRWVCPALAAIVGAQGFSGTLKGFCVVDIRTNVRRKKI